MHRSDTVGTTGGIHLARSSIGRWELFLPMHRIDPLPVGLGDLVAAYPVDSQEIDHFGRPAGGGAYQEIGKQALALSTL